MLSHFSKISHAFFSIALISLLSACGGGGGGGGDDNHPSTPASAVFPIAQAYANQLINGFSNNVKITGKVSGHSFTGSGIISVSPATAGAFENQTGLLANIVSINGTVTVSGTTESISSSVTSYSDSNYLPLGSIDADDGTYSVVTSSSALPTAAHVNDTGSVSSATTYTDSTKATVVGFTVSTFVVDSGTETSVIFHLIDKHYDGSNALVETVDERYRVTTDGIMTFVSVDYVSADGVDTEHVVPQ
jgi:hypothetical protein